MREDKFWKKLKRSDWEAFVQQWLSEIRGEVECGEAGEAVVAMNFSASPKLQWQFIIMAVSFAQSDRELDSIAAGPLEHLLGWHGKEFIDLVEEEAAINPKFARTLTGVWKYMMTDEIWSRVEALQVQIEDQLGFSDTDEEVSTILKPIYPLQNEATILDLLDIDIAQILFEPEIYKTVTKIRNTISINYIFSLNKKQLGVFDRVAVRIFDEVKKFRENVQTHLTLFSSTPIRLEDKIDITEKLVQLYGKDNGDNGDIEPYEKKILDQNRFWAGRTWYFNLSNGLCDLKNKNEELSYSVSIFDFNDDQKFNLHILRYNTLVSLFGSKPS